VFEGGRVVKIADMGISRMATNQSMTEFTGTQLYISPGKKIELTLNIIFMILLENVLCHDFNDSS
jgi:hypothetical protein